MSNVKYVLDRYGSDYNKQNAVAKVHRELGDRASVSGDVITVDTDYESKLADILNREGVNYSRSS